MACLEFQSLTEDLAAAKAGHRKAMNDYAAAQRQSDPAGWQDNVNQAKSELDRAEQEVKMSAQTLQEHRETCEDCRLKR
jgi:hypothetical protein